MKLIMEMERKNLQEKNELSEENIVDEIAFFLSFFDQKYMNELSEEEINFSKEKFRELTEFLFEKALENRTKENFRILTAFQNIICSHYFDEFKINFLKYIIGKYYLGNVSFIRDTFFHSEVEIDVSNMTLETYFLKNIYSRPYSTLRFLEDFLRKSYYENLSISIVA